MSPPWPVSMVSACLQGGQSALSPATALTLWLPSTSSRSRRRSARVTPHDSMQTPDPHTPATSTTVLLFQIFSSSYKIVIVTLYGPGAGGASAPCLPALEQAEHHGGGGAGGRGVPGLLDHSLALYTRQVSLFCMSSEDPKKQGGRNQQI